MNLAVITPSYRNDLALFLDLHASVLAHTGPDVLHFVIVPRRDSRLFDEATGPRCVIITEESLYSRHYRPVPAVDRAMHLLPGFPSSARVAALNLKRPFYPVRGWIMQQALKMEACRRIDADLFLILDSDVVLLREVSAARLTQGGSPRFYRRDGAVDFRLPRHVQWHEMSRRLLGLPLPTPLPAPDYVSSFNVWDPYVLRRLLARIERVTGRYWMDAVTAQRSFSEWTLYGVFVDEFMKDVAVRATEASLCHSYWDHRPLTAEEATEFAAATGAEDLAILIQSKSRTPMAVRHAVLRAFAATAPHDEELSAGPRGRDTSSHGEHAGGPSAERSAVLHHPS
jgi:hypothetical protein